MFDYYDQNYNTVFQTIELIGYSKENSNMVFPIIELFKTLLFKTIELFGYYNKDYNMVAETIVLQWGGDWCLLYNTCYYKIQAIVRRVGRQMKLI